MDFILRDDDENYDEEAEQRQDFHIECLVSEFVANETRFRHDSLPESDDEEDEGGGVRKPRLSPNVGRGDGNMFVNQAFFNPIAFKECVTDYVLKTGYNLKQYRYEKGKIGFSCVGSKDCPWKVYASVLPKDSVLRIRKFIDKHNCYPNGKCEMFKTPVIARLFVDKIRDEPDYYMPMKIEQIIKEKYKISASRPQCQVARLKALKWIEVEYDEQFKRLRDYAAEILESNEGSIVEIDTIKNDEGKDVFNRFYVCFDVLRKTWKSSCRPLIGVDGCFLKSKIKGQLLCAIGKDADNSIYLIAWSVVQVENKENWLWFIKRLKIDLELNDGDGYIMTSDRQKGLIAAVELELPKLEHRRCVKHLYDNLKKLHGNKKQLKPLLWHLAWSYNEKEYEERLDRLRSYDIIVYNDVLKTKPKTWVRAFYKLGSFCEDVDNNFTESFNNTIRKAREKPFVAMLETVRRLAMVRIATRYLLSHDDTVGLCTPYVAEYLAKNHEKAANCTINFATNSMYEVTLGGDYHRVSLRERTCTCRSYQITGIPCEHAYGVIIKKTLTVDHYVCQWFKTLMWKKNYTDGLIPQKSARIWPATDGADVLVPLEPAQPGRPKLTKKDKKRKKGANESPTKKQPKNKERTMHCGICGKAGHNCRFHKKNKSTNEFHASQGEPSQGEPSQGVFSQGIVSQA